MAKSDKAKLKLAQRIEQLETELKLSLQKKAAGPAINIASYTSKIQSLKKELADMK
jgi:hypothetical protein